jgi:hypothetical protein
MGRDLEQFGFFFLIRGLVALFGTIRYKRNGMQYLSVPQGLGQKKIKHSGLFSGNANIKNPLHVYTKVWLSL